MQNFNFFDGFFKYFSSSFFSSTFFFISSGKRSAGANSKPSGKIKTKKALTLLNEFIEDCFDKDGEIKVKEYTKNPSKTSCGYCPFKDDKKLCNRD
jgi:hypothetical protein